MAIDPLEKLLRDADADAGAGPPRHERAPERIRRLAHRRQRRKVAFATAAAAVLMVGLAVGRYAGRPDPVPTLPPIAKDVELRPVQPEIASQQQIQAEIARLESQVAVLLARERRAAAIEQLRKLPPPQTREAWAQEQLDRSAVIVLVGARVKHEQFALPESAAADYRRVTKLYPNTIWAETAAMRLAAIDREYPEELEP